MSPGCEAAFAEHGDRIAGVIFEPVVGNMGVVVPSRDFLQALRQLTRQHGALLICDEVMTGFRVAYGGAQQLLGIEPDLTTLGKIVGGGLPVGAYGGRAEIMDHVLPAGKVFQAGTLSGNPLATAAGCAMLRALRDDPPYERLEKLSARLEAGLREAAAASGRAASIRSRRQHDDAFLCRRAGSGLADGEPLRYGAVWEVVLGDAGSRRLLAVQPVRSAVRFGGAQRERILMRRLRRQREVLADHCA